MEYTQNEISEDRFHIDRVDGDTLVDVTTDLVPPTSGNGIQQTGPSNYVISLAPEARAVDLKITFTVKNADSVTFIIPPSDLEEVCRIYNSVFKELMSY